MTDKKHDFFEKIIIIAVSLLFLMITVAITVAVNGPVVEVSKADTSDIKTGKHIDIKDAISDFTLDESDEAIELDSVDFDLAGAMDLTGTEITEGGTYRLNGIYSDTVSIDAGEEFVCLILDGALVEAHANPAIWVKSARGVLIYALDGSVNQLSNVGIGDRDDKTNAVVYSDSDIQIAGSGKVKIKGRLSKGIATKDRLSVRDTKLSIDVRRTGIVANDGLIVKNADISVKSRKNGILTKNSGKDHKGDIIIDNSTLDILAGDFGIVSERNFYSVNSDISGIANLSEYSVKGKTFVR